MTGRSSISGCDRAPASGDQDGLAGEVALDFVQSDRHGLAAEQVLELDVAELPDFGAPGQQILQAGEDLERQLRLHAPLDDALQLGPRGGGDGDHEQLHAVCGRELRQSHSPTEHTDTVKRSPMSVGIVVDQADHP